LRTLEECFTGIVWENGAVLHQRQGAVAYLPFGSVDEHVVEALANAGVPFERGFAIVDTFTRYETQVWQAIKDTQSEVAIAHNKGALMVMPPGTSKGAGLARLLELCDFSPHNVVAFGDGENDLSLLQMAEIGVAVADAVPQLKEVATIVASQPGPAGVLEELTTYWLQGVAPALSLYRQQAIPVGMDDAGNQVSLSSAKLASENMGIFGSSGTGKSWVTGLLVEGMHSAGYQVLLIDPEGDHRELRSLPGMIALSGDQRTMPIPSLVAMLLEEASVSVVLDLCSYPVSQRKVYLGELLHILRPLKERKFRPHWIVMEEAQHFLPLLEDSILANLLPILPMGGWAFVSYRPDLLAEKLRANLHDCLVTRIVEPESVAALRQTLPDADMASLMTTPHGYIWLCGQGLVRLRAAGRRVRHIRHLYKYLDIPLPSYKRFAFRTEESYLGKEAASLYEFKAMLPRLPLESLVYHMKRGDFAAWVRGALSDGELANQLDKIARRESLRGEELRAALVQQVTDRYTEVYSSP
jgi:hypothetical protein